MFVFVHLSVPRSCNNQLLLVLSCISYVSLFCRSCMFCVSVLHVCRACLSCMVVLCVCPICLSYMSVFLVCLSCMSSVSGCVIDCLAGCLTRWLFLCVPVCTLFVSVGSQPLARTIAFTAVSPLATLPCPRLYKHTARNPFSRLPQYMMISVRLRTQRRAWFP